MDSHHWPSWRCDLLWPACAALTDELTSLGNHCRFTVPLALAIGMVGAPVAFGQPSTPPTDAAKPSIGQASVGMPSTQPGATVGSAQAIGEVVAADKASLPPALRVVKLLWKSQPASAATALEKSIDQALSRRQVDALRPHLPQLTEWLKESLNTPSDPRWVASAAALTLAGDASGVAALRAAVENEPAGNKAGNLQGQIPPALPLAKREFLLRAWLEAQQEQAIAYLHRLLDQVSASSNHTAWLEIAAQRGLQFDRQPTSAQLIHRWKALPKRLQVAVIEPLTQQSDSMRQLVDAIARGEISKDLVNTNQLLKWSAGSDRQLSAAIERVWGKLRASEDADRKAVVGRTLKLLRSGKTGQPVAGEQVFKRVCSQCHRLHGQGIEVGPDITSNGRGSFEQLVSNVMDPSLVIGTAFLAKTVLTADGQVLSGLVVAEDPRRMTLKIQGGKLVELDRNNDIETVKESTKSLMPDGLEQQMNEQELVDLFAYLSLIRPLGAPENETLPGTPPQLIK